MKIAKKVNFYCGNDKYSYGWIVIDGDTVYYKHSNGSMPYATNVILAMLGDRDIYNMAKDFVANGYRKNPFEITVRDGYSGCADVYLNLIGWLADKPRIVKRKKLLHISCYDKLNEGMSPLYIGDFVELVAYMSGRNGCNYGTLPRKIIRKASGCHYVWEREIGAGTTQITNIFGG